MNSTKEQLEQFLEANGFTQKGKMYLCQFHKDKTPSGSISQGTDGNWRYKCFGCGAHGDVWDLMDEIANKALGTSYKASKTPTTSTIQKSGQKKERIYTLKELENGEISRYINPDTRQTVLISVRYETEGRPKAFGLYIPTDKGWVAGRPDTLPLLNRSGIQTSSQIVVVEGEKCVKALYKIGIIATTKPGGCATAQNTDWSVLKGKDVVLWPDNDPPGRKFMDDVAQILRPICKVSILEPNLADLDPKEDAADMVQEYEGKPEQAAIIKGFIATAEPYGAGQPAIERFKLIWAGKWKCVSWPGWPVLTYETQALLPRTVTILVGGEGDGKSMFLSQAMIGWLDAGVKWVVLHLEGEDTIHYLQRAMAQKSGCAGMTETDWIGKNKDLSKEYLDEDFLNRFGGRIQECTEKEWTRNEVLEWIRGKAREDQRIIIVDPITAVKVELQPWVADAAFMWKAKAIGKEHDCSIIIVTHKTKAMDGVAGGAAYTRQAQTVLTLEHLQDGLSVDAESGGLTEKGALINKRLRVTKCRNAGGHHAFIGYQFSKTTLWFREAGYIVKVHKKGSE